MADVRTSVDLGFAEFATQLVAELQEAVVAAQAEQDGRRAELAELAAVGAEQFARRFVANEQVDTELTRLFPAAGSKGHLIRPGLRYRAASAGVAETPPLQGKLGIRFGARDLKASGKNRTVLTPAAVKAVREAVRLRLAEVRLKVLRQTAAQGMPRVVVDSGRVNVKLSFRLVDLDRLDAQKSKEGTVVPLKQLARGKGSERLSRLRLVVRQVNEQTAPAGPDAASGIGEFDLTFKTV
jgi:hypothetical protein